MIELRFDPPRALDEVGEIGGLNLALALGMVCPNPTCLERGGIRLYRKGALGRIDIRAVHVGGSKPMDDRLRCATCGALLEGARRG